MSSVVAVSTVMDGARSDVMNGAIFFFGFPAKRLRDLVQGNLKFIQYWTHGIGVQQLTIWCIGRDMAQRTALGYTYHLMALICTPFYSLAWISSTFCIPLFPLAALAEVITIYQSLPYFEALGTFSFQVSFPVPIYVHFPYILQLYMPVLALGTHFLYRSNRTPINMSIEVITIDQRTVTYRVVSMPGDGTCFFHSLCYILHGHIRLTLDIRRNTMSYALNDWDRFKVWTDDGTGDNYTTQEHYKSEMLKPITYGSAFCKDPPYKVEESGYAGFILPIEVYFRNKELSKCGGSTLTTTTATNSSFSKIHKSTKEHKDKSLKDSKDHRSALKEPCRELGKLSKDSKKPKENRPLKDEKLIPKMAFKEPKPMSKEPKVEASNVHSGGTVILHNDRKVPSKRPPNTDTELVTKKRKKSSSENLLKSSSSTSPAHLSCDKRQVKDKTQFRPSKLKIELEASEKKRPTLPPFEDVVDPNDSDMEDNMSVKSEQLEIAVRQSVASALSVLRNLPTQNDDKKLDASVKAEMVVFQSNGKRGRCLEQVYQYLMTVPPTSVEAERAFSAAGILCTKVRYRLNDRMLDMCFLHSYYRN
ncbi:AF9 protein, partial [Polypterus senegalus]